MSGFRALAMAVLAVSCSASSLKLRQPVDVSVPTTMVVLGAQAKEGGQQEALAGKWHGAIAKATAKFADGYAKAGMKVLDVGGRNVNGNARSIFEAKGVKFTCVDMEADPSVDVVIPPGDTFPFADGEFDLVITTSTFEHDPMFWMTIREMARVTRKDGFIFATAPASGVWHGYPGDSWRFYGDAAPSLAFWCGKTYGGLKAYPIQLEDTYFVNDKEEKWDDNVMVWKRTDTPAATFYKGRPKEHPGGVEREH